MADHELGRRRRPSWKPEIRWGPERQATGGVPEESRRRSRVGDPLVRAVARVPVTVRTKLLIAFVGTSLLLVAVGLLGQLVLGQSNDRVASVGAAPGTGRRVQPGSRRRPSTCVMAWRRTSATTSTWSGREQRRTRLRGAFSLAVDLSAVDAAVRLASNDGPGSTRIHAAAGDEEVVLDRIELTAERLSRSDRGRDHPALRGPTIAIDDQEHDRGDAAAAGASGAARERPRTRTLRSWRTGREQEIQHLIAQERELLRELPGPVHRRRGGRARPRTAAGVRPLVVGDRADPEHRHAALPRSRRATSRAAWRSRTETSSARWAPTSTG